MSHVIIPYAAEVLFKLVFIIKILDVQHKIIIFNAKVVPNQALTKGALFNITDIEPKYDINFLACIGNILSTISTGSDTFKTSEG